MGRLERYIFRQAFFAFVLCLTALTAVVWLTQALRELDLVTLKGQGLAMFFQITGLAVPLLMLAIAPVSLFLAILYTLNRLNADSELVVIAAAGISPGRIARPFLLLAFLVSVFSGFLSLWAAPTSMEQLRLVITQVRADIISSVVRDGVFTEIEKGLTFHIRQKGQDGALLGLLVNDERNPKRVMTYLAERGDVTETPQGSFLIMRDGVIQRRDNGRPDATIVVFQSYAIDLSQFSQPGDTVNFKPRERPTVDLLYPNKKEENFKKLEGKIRGELHDRFVAPLYPLAFAFITLAFLGHARTNRQSRFSAMIGVVIAVVGLRGLGFGLSSLVVADSSAVPLLYAAPIAAILASIVFGNPGVWARSFAGIAARIRRFSNGIAGLFLRQPRLEGAE